MNFETKVETFEVQKTHYNWSNIAEKKGTTILFYNDRLIPEMIKLEELNFIFLRNNSNVLY